MLVWIPHTARPAHLSTEVDVCADVIEYGVANLFIMLKYCNLQQTQIQAYFVLGKQK